MSEYPRDLAGDDLSHLDPDWDDVPPELAARDGTQVLIDGEPGTLVVAPGLHGHARRLRDGFYDPDTQEENQQ